jgi:hypothetical protein
MEEGTRLDEKRFLDELAAEGDHRLAHLRVLSARAPDPIPLPPLPDPRGRGGRGPTRRRCRVGRARGAPGRGRGPDDRFARSRRAAELLGAGGPGAAPLTRWPSWWRRTTPLDQYRVSHPEDLFDRPALWNQAFFDVVIVKDRAAVEVQYAELFRGVSEAEAGRVSDKGSSRGGCSPPSTGTERTVVIRGGLWGMAPSAAAAPISSGSSTSSLAARMM